MVSQSQRLLLNGLAGADNGLGWLAEWIKGLGYRPFAAPTGWPKSFNYRQLQQNLPELASSPIRQAQGKPGPDHPIAVGTFAPWYLAPSILGQWLAAPAPGEYWQGHLLWASEAASLLAELGYLHIVILRDPCAVIADLLRENDKLPDFLRADFLRLSASERLARICDGGPLPQAGVTLLPFKDFYPRMLAWRQDPRTFVLNLEEAPATLDALQAYLDVDGAQDWRTPLPLAASDWRHSLDAGIVEGIEAYCVSLTD